MSEWRFSQQGLRCIREGRCPLPHGPNSQQMVSETQGIMICCCIFQCREVKDRHLSSCNMSLLTAITDSFKKNRCFQLNHQYFRDITNPFRQNITLLQLSPTVQKKHQRRSLSLHRQPSILAAKQKQPSLQSFGQSHQQSRVAIL